MLKYVGEEISRSNPTLLADSALQFKCRIVVFVFWSCGDNEMADLRLQTVIALLLELHSYYYDFLYYDKG